MALLTLTKSADKLYAVTGEDITYTIVAKNDATIAINNVVIYDILDENLEFIVGSLLLDGVKQPQETILAGLNLGAMAPGQTHTLKFKAKILAHTLAEVNNIAHGDFSYQFIGGPIEEGNSESNNVQVTVFKASINLKKTVDRTQAALEDVITYTVVLQNTGNLTAYNILFKDELAKQGEIVPKSFKINNKVVNNVNLKTGIVVGSIVPQGCITLSYKVKIIGNNCSGTLTNKAMASFTYRLVDGRTGIMEATGVEQMVTVNIDMSTFKQLSIEAYLNIPGTKPDIEALNGVKGSIDSIGCHVIHTPISLSTGGQNLTGYKLIVKGILNLSVEYTALEETQSVHSAHYVVPFSTFIILPPDYVVESRLEVTGIVEDIFFKALDTRTFFTNTTALINVKILGC